MMTMTTPEFNRKSAKARLSKGLEIRPEHYQFARQHDSQLPFPDDTAPQYHLGARLVGALAAVGLVIYVFAALI